MIPKKISLAILAVIGVVVAPRFACATGSEIDLNFVNVIDPISSDYIGLYSGTSSAVSFDGYATLQDIPAGSSSQSVVISPAGSSVVQDSGGVTPTFFGIAGVYTGSDDAQGVSVGVNASTAATLESETYSQAFAPLGEPESLLVGFLESPNLSLLPTSLASFVNGFSGQISPAVIGLDGSEGELVNFSDGAAGGQVSASIVPVPGGPSGPSGGTAVPLPVAAWMAMPLLVILAGAKFLRRNLFPMSR